MMYFGDGYGGVFIQEKQDMINETFFKQIYRKT
jgi:hypothetical protein